MRYIRTSNNYVEFIEASDNGNILSTRGFQFGELYFQIKNGKVTFYLNDQENPWRNDVWTINIPFELDGVVYDNEDDASAVLHNIMNDRFQEQLDELRADLEEEIGRSTAMDEALQEEIDDERDRAISAETHLQTEVTELSGLVATFDERITQAEEDAAEALSAVTAEVIRSTAKDAEHDAAISGLTTGLNNEIQRAISAETEIANDLDAEITRSTAKDGQHDAQISALTTSLDNEIQRAIEAESGLRGDLDAEIANRLSGDTRLENLLNSEVARAISAETNLHDEILGEEARALAAESALSETLSSEIVRSTNKDTEHDDLISGLTDDVADLEANKQDNLVAGDYITINGNVISADSNHVYRLTQAAYNALEEIDPDGFYIIVDAQDVDLRDYTPLSAFTAEVTRSTQKDIEHDNLISASTGAINSEIANRTAADNLLQSNLTNEHNRAISAETELHNEILAERDRALAAESGITANLNAEVTRATARENAIDDKIDGEISRSTAKDSAHDTAISGLTQDLATEVSNRTSADNLLQQNITNEHNRAISAETSLHDEVIAERDRALAAESGITANLNTEIQNRIADVDAEETRALAAESALSNSINAEIARATSAETAIQNSKADRTELNNYYTKTESDNKYASKEYVSGNTYTKNETDALLANKADSSALTQHVGDTVKHITAAERTAWNAKSDFSGSYNDLTDKPTIPSLEGYATQVWVSGFTYDKATIDNKIAQGGTFDPTLYYQKSETSGKTEISNALATKLDVTAYTPTDLSNYYTKSETSGKTEISNALAAKQNTLTPGSGISIVNDVISITGGTSLNLPISAGTDDYHEAIIFNNPYNVASGTAANAFGVSTKAYGGMSIAVGTYTEANAFASFAGGDSAKTNSTAAESFAYGQDVETKNIGEAAFGIRNKSSREVNGTSEVASGSTLFSVGNPHSIQGRDNALEIRKDDSIYIVKTPSLGTRDVVRLQDYLTSSADVQTQISNSISGKTNQSDFSAHTADTTIHVTTAQTAAWNAKSDFSGSYNDLTDKPTLFSGSYNDLTDKPTLFSGDYNDLTNKPTLFSGDYNDLSNKPTIPTVPSNVSAFNNDAGYITNDAISGKVDVSDFETYSGNVQTALNGKQDTLSAGTGVDITNNVISVTGGSQPVDAYTKTESDNKYATITNFNSHSGDTTMHVTSAQTSSWDAKPNVWCGTEGEWSQISGSTVSGTIYLVY